MSYVVYDKESTAIVSNRVLPSKRYQNTSVWKSEGAAKAFLTRLAKAGHDRNEFAIAEGKTYETFIAKTVERVNLMTGKKYTESVNTPISCSPASETYWSM